ncbi:MAG: hypothetical protein GXO47_09835, partial [Chlorobi bacterium]|nr:hypothetical protein [Chlorobiota bacterium]
MFLISKNKNALRAFKFFLNELNVHENGIYEYFLNNGYKLIWTSIKPSDNLTLYRNGFVIGKNDFLQPYNVKPYEEKNKITDIDLHPLLNSCYIRNDKDGIGVHP